MANKKVLDRAKDMENFILKNMDEIVTDGLPLIVPAHHEPKVRLSEKYIRTLRKEKGNWTLLCLMFPDIEFNRFQRVRMGGVYYRHRSLNFQGSECWNSPKLNLRGKTATFKHYLTEQEVLLKIKKNCEYFLENEAELLIECPYFRENSYRDQN